MKQEWVMFRWSVFYELWMACDTLEERAELWQSIMEYWLYGKEPPEKFKRDFVNIRFILEKSKSISEKRSEAWKKWWAKQWNQNAVKNFEKVLKQAKQPKQAKTNKTSEREIEREYIKKENVKEKKKYLDFVELTDDEYNKLLKIFWQQRLDQEIQKLNNYIWSKWVKYKSHYFTLRNRNQDFIQEKERREKELNTTQQNLYAEQDLLWTITIRR